MCDSPFAQLRYAQLTCVSLICPVLQAMADVLSKADSTFRFQLEEVGVGVDAQKKIIETGFTSLRVFAGLQESRAEVRKALKSTFGFDAESSPEMRKEVALLLCVWEAARAQLAYQGKNKQEAKLGRQNRLVQNSEYGAMRAALENSVGKLRDREAPSKALVALQLEQLEDGVPIAEDLRDVTSFEDAEGEAYSAVIDPATATLRIRPGRASTIPPSSPEELRLRRRRLGLAWAMVAAKHSTRAWLPSNCVDCFRKLSDHVLGSSVAGLRTASGQGPTWALVLSYEMELRKTAYRYVRDGRCGSLDAAIEKACEAPDVMNTHFIVPFTLGKVESCDSTNVGISGKGFGGGKAGKSGKGGENLWERQWGKATKTPDGRCICWRFNKKRAAQIQPADLRMCATAASASIHSRPVSFAKRRCLQMCLRLLPQRP